jgi:hypothetical protein
MTCSFVPGVGGRMYSASSSRKYGVPSYISLRCFGYLRYRLCRFGWSFKVAGGGVGNLAEIWEEELGPRSKR